ncbi:hypothetical protein L9Z41_14760 [Leptospira noguchii]|nr:hypothetical protein [Leptospira noguchii]MCH1910992.1 hypothetical protein [Leptospira noguchii]MCH1916856.1 hypothetical protein [Leptospira noguchii]UOG43680.1 hypothetical protein MAL01_09250 [Leptospira noguchii]UOG65533.1 hypothetical protein MAL04_09075 [Leptospira noguchii]
MKLNTILSMDRVVDREPAILSMKFASCDDDAGVVAPEFTIRPIFSMNPR